MDKQKVIDFINSQNDGSHFNIIDTLEEAKDSGIIKFYQHVNTEMIEERRWGYVGEFIWNVDDCLLCFDMYITTGDDGDDELCDVYEVIPKEVTKIEYVKVDS